MEIIFLLLLVASTRALDNGLGLTPPMGWMTWERFRCITDCEKYPKECISENLIMEMADAMVNEGYLDAGYEYVNIDDCWSELERDGNGKIVADKKRFPRGINFLSDYVHSKGLKFGIYLDYGTKTCAGYPGSIDHLETDAKSLAEWEVDFIKMDGCYAEISGMIDGYAQFGKFMNITGRPIMFSCSWPAYFGLEDPDYEALKETCNLWRNWDDIDDSWQSWLSIADYFSSNQDVIAQHAGPGHWNDPDTLLLGNFGLSLEQSKAQLAVWAILAAPFLLSNDLRSIQPEIKDLMLNREVIAIDQDALGIQGKMISKNRQIEIWARPVLPIIGKEFSYAIAFVSRRTDGHAYATQIKLRDLHLGNKAGYIVTDLFDHQRVPHKFLQSDSYEERVNPSGANFYKFVPIR